MSSNYTSSDFTKLGKLISAPDESWDVVVVGAGHNSLIAAAYLAVAGKKVLVLERNSYAGGVVVSMEMSERGHHSERHAAIHHLILANLLTTQDELKLQSHYGLHYIPIESPYAVITEENCLVLYQNRHRTIEGIKKFSMEDAESYNRFMNIAIQVTDLIVPSMFEPPRDLSAEIAKSPVAKYIMEANEKSNVEITKKWFKHDMTQVALVRLVSETQLAHPLREKTGLMCYLLTGMLQKYGMALP